MRQILRGTLASLRSTAGASLETIATGLAAGGGAVSFDPADATRFAVLQGGTITFRNVATPGTTTVGRGPGGPNGAAVTSFSWTRR